MEDNMCDQNPRVSKNMESPSPRIRVNMDTLLTGELGQIGLYQIRTLLLFSMVTIFIAWSSTEYIFTAARIQTRCLIPECEQQDSVEFSPDWIINAIPSTNGAVDMCQRFNSLNNSDNNISIDNVCPAELFDRQNIVECESYVYENTNTVVHTFNLACDEWSRSIIGSIRTIGVFCALPLVGFISDRFGRRVAIAVTSINMALIGILRYFADTYIGFVISQFAESLFGGGGFSALYIFMTETVGPKYRLAAGSTLSSSYALGQGLTGLIAWAVPDWRLLTLTLYVPQLIALFYFWILPESPRWYLSKQKYEQAATSIKTMARVNRKKLSENIFTALKENDDEEKRKQELKKNESANEPWLVVIVFKNKPILIRCLVIPIWWVTSTFVYYSLTINSVNISGNSYINFLVVSLVEIPGFWASFVFMDLIGRKPTLVSAFWTCAACQIAYIFMPSGNYGASLAVYLIAKFAIATVATSIYIYTSELFPTVYRHRLFAFCSMIGRIGAIVAPLTPAFSDQLPFILFGSFALVAGFGTLLMPETKGKRLPDTLQDVL